MEPYRPIIDIAEANYDLFKRVSTGAFVHAGRLHLFGAAPIPQDAVISGSVITWTDSGVAVTQTAVPHCEDISVNDYIDLTLLADRLEPLDADRSICLRWTLAESCVEVGVHGDLARTLCQMAPSRAHYARTPVAYTVTWSLSRRVVVTCYVTDPTILQEIA